MRNTELNDLSSLHKKIGEELEKIDKELFKAKADQPNTDSVYCITYIDDSRNQFRECYTDRKDAEKRFIEIMESVFEYEIKDSPGNWDYIQEFENTQFHFTKDMYKSKRTGILTKEQEDKYPYNTWLAEWLDGYSELVLERVKLNMERYALPTKQQ